MEIKLLMYILLFLAMFYNFYKANKKIKISRQLTLIGIIFCYFILDIFNLPTQLLTSIQLNKLIPLLDTQINVGEIIAFSALTFTLITYNKNSEKDKINREEDRIHSTFMKILDLIIDKSNNIKEEEIKTFFETVKSELTIDNRYKSSDIHKAYMFKYILRDNMKRIKKLLKDENIEVYEKLYKVSNSNNKKVFWRILLHKKIKPSLNLNLSITRPTKNSVGVSNEITDDEINILIESKVFQLLESKCRVDNIMNKPITYIHAFTSVDQKVERNLSNNGDFFRLIHRAIKTVNDSNVRDKDKYYGILRAMLPDYLIVYIFYNCVYTNRGLGLGLQLIGTSFFGDEDDLSFLENKSILKTAQHFPKNYLIFREQDPRIMLELFSNLSKSSNLSIEEYQKKINYIFTDTDAKFCRSVGWKT